MNDQQQPKQEKKAALTEQTNINPTEASNQELLLMAHRQANEFDQERKQAELELSNKDRKIMELIQANNASKKFAADKVKEMNNLKLQSVLEGGTAFIPTNEEVKLTPEQITMQLIAKVIHNRRVKAEEILARKNDNVFINKI